MFSNMSERLKNILKLIFVIAVTATVTGIIYYLLVTNPDVTSRSLKFEVEADGGFSIITLQAGNVSIKPPATVSTPWQKTVRVASGSEVYLTASNPSQTGKLTCRVSFDGQPWKEETTVAPKDGVACAGIVP